MGVNPQLIGPREILDWYISKKYTMIPSYYSKKKDHRCRFCNEENRSSTPSICPTCNSEYHKARKENKSIQGISVQEMSLEDYLVFKAIHMQTENGEAPYATAEAYSEEFKEREKNIREALRKDAAKKQNFEKGLYD